MRLTDADKLKPLFSPALTGKTTYTADEIMLSIVSSPTVDAIPIEWLKEYATNFENKIAEERLHLGISRAKGIYWRGENGEWVGIDFKNPITEMLENWGKENETSRLE